MKREKNGEEDMSEEFEGEETEEEKKAEETKEVIGLELKGEWKGKKGKKERENNLKDSLKEPHQSTCQVA